MSVTKRYYLTLIFLIFLSPFDLLAETITEIPNRIPTVTRWVTLFYDLESSLANALHTKDEATLDQIVDSSFELRLASQPDQPIPRDVWIKAALIKSPLYAGQIINMAVHNIQDTAIVSYEWINHHKVRDKKIFIVDVWKQENHQWKLMVRYSNDARGFRQYLKNNFINKKY